MDALAKASLIEERRVNSSIRSAMSPREEEVDPASAIAVESLEDVVAEEGLTIGSGPSSIGE
jgi:hypothetical protein